jgi:glycine/D-amino acid oxidase-like deaminating enzyme
VTLRLVWIEFPGETLGSGRFGKGVAVVTQSKDLRTGYSVWQRHRAPPIPHQPLKRDLKTDVLVIGAGITGAMVADALASNGMKVMVVDRRGPAKGSTTASTALVQYEIDTPLTTLSRKIGKRDAARAWRRSRLAVDALAARLGELGLSDVARRDTLYLAGNVLDRDGLLREHQARRAIGLPSRFLDRSALRERFGIARPAALLGYANLAIDPRQVTIALFKSTAARSVRIFAPVDIVEVDPGRSGVTATDSNGWRIECRHLVFATGYELPKVVSHKGHQIVSTWAIATVPQRRNLWREECLIWEASAPYLYLRTTPDGRIICGGEDEEFSDEAARDALLPRKTAALRRKLKQLIRNADTNVDFAWAGSFGSTATGLPTIGQVPGLRHCWVALGYGGNGTTYSRIAADVIAGALAGRPDIDADLYDFPR